MKALPFDIGGVHFIGIGGIGMSGIAEVMHILGYKVQGSDQNESQNVRRLQAKGVPVHVGHAAENIGSARAVVVSSAIRADNPELIAARQQRLPVVPRAEMLAELMRLKWSIAVGGTHGKTTTTSLIAALLDAAGLDPTVINGGIINAYGTNARLGSGEWMVVEADESDGSFIKLPATAAVITNIDPEHMEFYGDFDSLRAAFQTFVENLPFYGVAAVCIDHTEVQALIGRVTDRRIVTYGFNPQADIRAELYGIDRDGAHFDVEFSERVRGGTRTVSDIRLPMFGHHNVLNSLAAIAIAVELGIDDATIAKGLASFSGVKRRFTETGNVNGVRIIDDYGHHPVEIAAVLAAARSVTDGRVIAVVQPHRYSRLSSLFEDFCTCFNDADHVIVADVYAAGEAPVENANRDALVEGLLAHGHRLAEALPDADALPVMIQERAAPGDLVICLGAGTITQWANSLPQQLQALQSSPAQAGAAS